LLAESTATTLMICPLAQDWLAYRAGQPGCASAELPAAATISMPLPTPYLRAAGSKAAVEPSDMLAIEAC
jgi:hypothetical protein